MATADLTVIGLGRSDPSAGEYIAEIQRRLGAQDRVRYRMHAMGTSLEGATEDILAVVGELHAVPFFIKEYEKKTFLLNKGLPISGLIL